MTVFDETANAEPQVAGLHQSAPDRVRTFKHTLDFRTGGDHAAAVNGDTFTLVSLPVGTIFRYRQDYVIREVSTAACTFKANASQTAASIAAGADALVDATPATASTDGNVQAAAPVSGARGLVDNDGGAITASIASGAPAGALIDIYTRIEIFG
jgi:hypothetical protein